MLLLDVTVLGRHDSSLWNKTIEGTAFLQLSEVGAASIIAQ